MNKRKLFYAMCCLTAVLAIGCGKKDSTDTKNPEQVESQDTTKTDDENKSDTKNDTEQTDDKKEESEKTKTSPFPNCSEKNMVMPLRCWLQYLSC